jgi:citrate lyase subunit beta / citryl-CoA lyase
MTAREQDITMPIARSFLYVPANREKFLEKAIGLPSDAFLFDLEDSVPAAEKANARAGVREYAPKIPDNRVWVRVNGLDTGLATGDLDAVIGVAGIAGIFLPKHWDAMIGALETRRGLETGAIKLVLSIEARFDSPLDGVFADVRDPEGFERDTTLSRRLGYRGRKLIHPSQIEPCNRLYRPSAAELDYYARVLEAFDAAVEQGSASTTVDGRMIDLAMANAARRVIAAEAAWKNAG